MELIIISALIYLSIGLLFGLWCLWPDIFPQRILGWTFIFSILGFSALTWPSGFWMIITDLYYEWKDKKKK